MKPQLLQSHLSRAGIASTQLSCGVGSPGLRSPHITTNTAQRRMETRLNWMFILQRPVALTRF